MEEGTFRIHKFKQPIGEERYRILVQNEGRRLTTTFEFTDRGTPVRLDGALDVSSGLAPRHFDLKALGLEREPERSGAENAPT